MSERSALVVGGTGPTGPHIVNGLIERGFAVAICNRGRHDSPLLPTDPEVLERLVADPYDEASLRAALADRSFDLVVASYGRLRMIAEVMADRTEQFVSVGGFPVYQGYRNTAGLPSPVPTAEDGPFVAGESEDPKGWAMVATEASVFAHHPSATHVRYPVVYGPGQPLPREWCVVRRALDGRRRLILPDGGLTLTSIGFAENVAHAVLLTIDRRQRSAGRIYNCGDAQPVPLRRWVEILADALGHTFDLVSMPTELAIPARPMLSRLHPNHRFIDTSRIRHELGYSDAVSPEDALTRTARWLADNPPERGGIEEQILQDPFDYESEDALLAGWDAATAPLRELSYDPEPGPTMGFDLNRR